MNMPLVLLSGFLLINLAALYGFFLYKQHQKQEYRRTLSIRQIISSVAFSRQETSHRAIKMLRRNRWIALRQLALIHGSLVLQQEERERLSDFFDKAGISRYLLRNLDSRRTWKRYAAALYLRFLLDPSQRDPLSARLHREKLSHIRIALVKGLLTAETDTGFDVIAESLSWEGDYARSVASMMRIAGYRYIGWARRRLDSSDSRYKRAILYGAAVHTTEWLTDFAKKMLSDPDPLVREAAASCSNVCPEILVYQNTPTSDNYIRGLAIRAEARRSFPLDLPRFLCYFDEEQTFMPARKGLQEYISRHLEEIETLLDLLESGLPPEQQRGAALSLIGRLPFLLANRTPIERIAPVINEAVASGYSASIISFLNLNRDPALQTNLLHHLRPLAHSMSGFRESCQHFLSSPILKEMGLGEKLMEKDLPRTPLGSRDRAILVMLLVSIVTIPCVLLYNAYSNSTDNFSLVSFFNYSIHTFSAVFAWYAVTLNSIYFALLGFSAVNLIDQTRYWNIHDQEFLFTPGVVPSVSIIAPAYNEEKTVIESVNSLLTLVYPDYEVIIVNDGSKDGTIDILQQHFHLSRVDMTAEGGIHTAPVRGIYRSPLNQRLLVIDKENGGKADALNCGINHAGREYICSIDSDSLLEPDSLLRMTTEAMVGKHETIAIGGNILPVNGCEVDHGALQNIHLSKNRYVRLQTIEYLRSFVAGRLGWAKINALLIISGAFGLFRRTRVMEIGGYLTGRGIHQRDTVGEDMELVVRLIRHMGGIGQACRVAYAATANCWTEVPEKLSGLYKQRDRWHRGLAEIMTYHRDMILNPKYGASGLLAMTYFLLFEIIGPFYEFAGYLFLIAGFATGVLSSGVFLIMFSVIVLYGTLISLTSLILSENGIVYFKSSEVFTLLRISFTENLGYRQLMSWIRVFSLVGMLFTNKGWQKLERKGFGNIG
jgi:peptidoglycan-N-acetylglucosamine deacetylase